MIHEIVLRELSSSNKRTQPDRTKYKQNSPSLCVFVCLLVSTEQQYSTARYLLLLYDSGLHAFCSHVRRKMTAGELSSSSTISVSSVAPVVHNRPPAWVDDESDSSVRSTWGEPLRIPEWDENAKDYRVQHGWKVCISF